MSIPMIPAFKSEDEEAEFWLTHSITDELSAELEPAPPLVPRESEA